MPILLESPNQCRDASGAGQSATKDRCNGSSSQPHALLVSLAKVEAELHSSWIARQFLDLPNSAGTVESRQTGLEDSLEHRFVEEEASPDTLYVARQFLNVPNSTGAFKIGWIDLENSFKFGNNVVEREEAAPDTSFGAGQFWNIPNSTKTVKSWRTTLENSSVVDDTGATSARSVSAASFTSGFRFTAYRLELDDSSTASTRSVSAASSTYGSKFTAYRYLLSGDHLSVRRSSIVTRAVGYICSRSLSYLKYIRRSGTKYTSRTRLSNADLASCRPRLEQMEISDNEETERREAELYE